MTDKPETEVQGNERINAIIPCELKRQFVEKLYWDRLGITEFIRNSIEEYVSTPSINDPKPKTET